MKLGEFVEKSLDPVIVYDRNGYLMSMFDGGTDISNISIHTHYLAEENIIEFMAHSIGEGDDEDIRVYIEFDLSVYHPDEYERICEE